jgi:hypothetical protein
VNKDKFYKALHEPKT